MSPPLRFWLSPTRRIRIAWGPRSTDTAIGRIEPDGIAWERADRVAVEPYAADADAALVGEGPAVYCGEETLSQMLDAGDALYEREQAVAS